MSCVTEEVIVDFQGVKKHFPLRKGLTVKAVDGVSFQLRRGEVFGLVGESGSGKSTVARLLMNLETPTEGKIYYKNHEVSDKHIYAHQKKEIQKNMQIIFQDSASALNPRMTVQEIIGEPLKVNHMCAGRADFQKKIDDLLQMVGLDSSYKNKYPEEISGGQRQRVSIARSICMDPELVVADEPIAALDVSIQAQIVTLFQQLQRKKGFSFLFIAHDLSMVRFISDRIGVMYRGKLVEMGETTEIFSNPLHPYTKSLLSAIPVPDPAYERQKQVVALDESTISLEGEMVEKTPEHFVLQKRQ